MYVMYIVCGVPNPLKANNILATFCFRNADGRNYDGSHGEQTKGISVGEESVLPEAQFQSRWVAYKVGPCYKWSQITPINGRK